MIIMKMIIMMMMIILITMTIRTAIIIVNKYAFQLMMS